MVQHARAWSQAVHQAKTALKRMVFQLSTIRVTRITALFVDTSDRLPIRKPQSGCARGLTQSVRVVAHWSGIVSSGSFSMSYSTVGIDPSFPCCTSP